jgi:hypothetical protein
MGTSRIRLLTNLRRRLGFHVGRPRQRTKRLSVAVFPVPADTGYFDRYWAEPDGDTCDVVHVLGGSDRTQWRDGPDHRPRSFDGGFTRTGPDTWTVEGPREPSFTVTFDSAATGYEL